MLDLHNYARYENSLIGSETVHIADFADVWSRIAPLFKGKDHVIFGLMNEPHDVDTDTWVDAANAAVSAIRDAGAENLILVPGNGWSAAFNWYGSSYGIPNAEALLEDSRPVGQGRFRGSPLPRCGLLRHERILCQQDNRRGAAPAFRALVERAPQASDSLASLGRVEAIPAWPL